MTWTTEAIPMLRVLISDVGSLSVPQEYSDSDLTSALVVAAKLIISDTRITTYSISVSGNSITPDPEDDLVFMNMMTVRGACLIDTGNYRSKAMLEGIQVQCGPAELQVNGHLAGFLELLKNGYCGMYAELKKQYLFRRC